MIESILFLIATTFLTVLAFVMVLMYFGIIKIETNIKKEFKTRKLTKEERKEYGLIKWDLNFDIRGKKFGYKTKKKEDRKNDKI